MTSSHAIARFPSTRVYPCVGVMIRASQAAVRVGPRTFGSAAAADGATAVARSTVASAAAVRRLTR